MTPTSPGAPVLERPRHGARPAHRREELAFTLPPGQEGAIPALAAFALALARHRGDDAVVVRVRTARGAAQVALDTSANLASRDFVARVADALEAAGVWPGAEDEAVLGSLAARAGEEGGGAGPVALRVDGAGAAAGALLYHADAVAADEAARFLARVGVVRAAMAARPERG